MKKLLSTLVTIILTIALLIGLTNFLEVKTADQKHKQFFEEKNQFDVLYLGSSHMLNGVYPMVIWEDYGFTGYNWGNEGHALPTSYWVMMQALEYQTPKMVVIDGYYLSHEAKSINTYHLHRSLDAFPLSIMKIKAVRDILDDPHWEEQFEGEENRVDEPRDPLYLLWDYAMYHTRWNEITVDNFHMDENVEKGAESKVGVDNTIPMEKISPELKTDPGHVGEKYLRMMIEECQNRGIDVLLTYFPGSTIESRQMEANRLYDIADEYGVNYVNFLDIDVIDDKTDIYNFNNGDNAHLNTSGARKVSKYLGQYIKDNYDFEDKRDNSQYESWNGNDISYSNYQDGLMYSQERLIDYLAILAGRDFTVNVELDNIDVLQNEVINRSFENLVNTTDTVVTTVDGGLLGEAKVHIVVTRGDNQLDDVIFTLTYNTDDYEITNNNVFRQ